MEIYLIRHGETTGDVEGRYGGEYDDSLSPQGLAQSRELAARLRGKGIGRIYHSPKARARETATSLAACLGVPLEEVQGVRERNSYGVLTGLERSEARLRFPEEVEKLEKDALRHGVEGSEDYDAFARRVGEAFEGILSRASQDAIAIVSHGGPIAWLLRERLGKEVSRIEDCAVVSLRFEGGKLSLQGLQGISLE